MTTEPSFSLDAITSLRSTEYPSCLLSVDGNEELSRALELYKLSPDKWRRILKNWITADCQGVVPPLEFLWKLNEEEVMFVTTYFYILPHRVEVLHDTFHAMYSTVICSESVKQSAWHVLASIFATIINTLTHHNLDVQTLFKGVTTRIIQSAIKLIDEGAMQGCYLTNTLNSVYIFQSCLHEFLLLNLKQLLAYPQPEIDSATVVSMHTKEWTTKALNLQIHHFISKVLSLLPPELVIAELKSTTSTNPMRWKYFLAVISVFIHEHGTSSQHIKNLIDEWLKIGLEENNKDLLCLAFVTARQCCAEKTKSFPSYISWFGASQPTNPSHFTNFFVFLSELVPSEPPLYLKIHVNKVPSAPQGCQSLLNDYITLAKTRLADLNLTTDYLSIFNECYDTDEESLAADVAQLLNHFSTTSEIAKPVIEASVFRKQYYEKVFLKYLLSVPSKEDPTRAQVIQKLHSTGKIPSNMYFAWTAMG